MIDRRSLLKLMALSPLAGVAARAATNGPSPSLAPASSWPRKLVLVELQGGNDGLNTVVPIGDPLYAKLRPTLAHDARGVIGLHDARSEGSLALAPGLAKLAPILDAGELAVVVGVGYPRPVRSHFRSADIWHTGSGADAVLDEGWVARIAGGVAAKRGAPARGLVVAGDAGPLEGTGFAALAADGDKTSRRTERGEDNAALAHIARVHDEVKAAHKDVERVVQGELSPRALEGKAFLEECRVAARAVTSLDVAVVKLTLRGFDTHTGQREQHARLLEELATGLADLREKLKASGAWSNVIVATTSEFGRRARENGSGGTDHGTAAPLFVLGGRVKGGVVGVEPRLDDLDEEGDVRFTTDYRAVLGGLAGAAWDVDAADAARALGDVKPLRLV